MIYWLLLVAGALGFGTQVALGFFHVGGHHGGSDGHHGHGVGHDVHIGHDAAHAIGAHHGTAHAAPAHVAAAHAAGHTHSHGHNAAHTDHASPDAATKAGTLLTAFSWLSPMSIFSVFLGTGLAGVLLTGRFDAFVVAGIAIACGLAMNLLVVQPVMRLLLGFASKPAVALKGSVAQNATVVSKFDAQGRGVVRISVDGQIVRLLAELEEEDKVISSEIKQGDTLVVTSVNGPRNTCRVARI